MTTGRNQPKPHFATCPCQHCNCKIEFDAGQFEKGETRLTECPHCRLETIIFVSPAEPPPSPPQIRPVELPTPAPQPLWFGSEGSLVKIHTNSGTSIHVKEVQLYDELELKEIFAERAQVVKLLGGAQSALGFIGDAFWVISNMLVQDYILNKQSEMMAKEGLARMDILAKREQKIRKTQNFFPVGCIENIDCPVPNLWRVTIVGRSSGFIHSGIDFVAVKGEDGIAHSIRWSSVEDYIFEANL